MSDGWNCVSCNRFIGKEAWLLGSGYCAATTIEQQARELSTLRTALRETAAHWKRSAEDMRLNRGQRTREKMGREVLENCAYALEDMLAEAPKGETP